MTAPYQDLTGLILAGGASRRFGSDKARHLVGEQVMIAHVAEAVRDVAGDLLVSVREAHERREVVGARYVADAFPGEGPLAGLHAGLLAAQTPWVLVVACDMPFITPGALRRLAGARSPAVDAVVARDADGRRHPLLACYHVRVAPVVEEQLLGGERAVHALLRRLRSVTAVELPDEVVRNVNRPSDLLS